MSPAIAGEAARPAGESSTSPAGPASAVVGLTLALAAGSEISAGAAEIHIY
jgi:hypothetical protein